jgi:hypothetical protein
MVLIFSEEVHSLPSGRSADGFRLFQNVRRLARNPRPLNAAEIMGVPPVLSFQSACSGCGSAFTTFGTWAGRAGVVQRVETVALPSRESASSDSRGAAIRNARVPCRYASFAESPY